MTDRFGPLDKSWAAQLCHYCAHPDEAPQFLNRFDLFRVIMSKPITHGGPKGHLHQVA